MTDREHLHKLVDALPESDVPALVRIAEALVQTTRKVSWEELCELLDSAPEDDELETQEEAAAVAEAREDVKAGRVVTWGDAWKRLGHG